MDPNRKEFLKNLLSNFAFSLSQGLSASSQAGPGDAGSAGLGAALQAPMVLDQMRQEQAERARAEQQRQQQMQMQQEAATLNKQQLARQYAEEEAAMVPKLTGMPPAGQEGPPELSRTVQIPGVPALGVAATERTMPTYEATEAKRYEEERRKAQIRKPIEIYERFKTTEGKDDKRVVPAILVIDEDGKSKVLRNGKEVPDAEVWKSTLQGKIDEVKQEQVQVLGEGIIRGDQPPVLTRMYGWAAPIKAYLASDKNSLGHPFDLAQAELDWMAMTRYMGTLNGDRQLRLRQAINFANEHIAIIEELYAEWQKTGLPTGFKVYNKAALIAAANSPGPAGEIASALIANINDFTSEMATVYKGGNASTDETLKLAAENLKGEWNEGTFKKQVGILKRTLHIRSNSVNLGPMGMSGSMPYGWGSYPQQRHSQPQTLSVGDIVDGMEYIGGDPNQESSWREK